MQQFNCILEWSFGPLYQIQAHLHDVPLSNASVADSCSGENKKLFYLYINAISATDACA